jgi:hypothetical protein
MKSTINSDKSHKMNFDEFMKLVRMNIGNCGTDRYWYYIYNNIIVDGDDPIEVVIQDIFYYAFVFYSMDYAMNATANDMWQV